MVISQNMGSSVISFDVGRLLFHHAVMTMTSIGNSVRSYRVRLMTVSLNSLYRDVAQ